MASENNEISDIVKKCKTLLLDIEGTTTSISFVKDKLFPYAEANVKDFLESQWENKEVKETVIALKKQATEDKEKNVEGVIAIPGEDASKDEQIEGLVNSVKWQMSVDRKAGPLKQLQGLIWMQGYDKGDIKGHVYDDVAPALDLWRSTEGQKVYIYSSGSVQAQKLLFNKSVAGDLLPHIEGHFDTAVGAKQEAASYAAIAEKIGAKPEEILFLTDIVKEAEAARASGLQTALVSREGNAPLSAEDTAAYPVLHSLEQLTITNKRKPDPQEQEVPAKVPKTDIEADVKTATETEANGTTESVPASEIVATNGTAAETVSKDTEEPEKMEVEEEIPAAETAAITEQVAKVAEEAQETPVRVETIITEVTNSNEAVDTNACDIEPVIEESVEKTEKNETEKMETDSTENVETVATTTEPKETVKENVDEQSAPVAEETPLSSVTVQDVTDDQQNVSGDTEDVDIVPVVEEPPTVEMEELKNAGDVLEKECDDILSKVQDVTNLDNIPVKSSLLSSIAEETMDAENGENTNDIVESILDSEMELASKASQNIDVKTVSESAETKAEDVVAEKCEKVEVNVKEVTVTVEEKPTDIKIAENVVEESKAKENVEAKDKEEKIKDSGSVEEATQGKQEETKKDESTVETEVTKDVKESKPEPVENKMEINDIVAEPECIVPEKESKVTTEPVDKVTESPAELEDKKMESEESTAALVDNKTEIKESTAEPIDNKAETKEPVDVEMESSESIVEPVENQKASENITLEPAEKKAETDENIAEQVDNKMESDVKPVENKMESEESTPQKSDMNESNVKPEAAVTESKANENNADEKETSEPVAPEPVKDSKEQAPQDILMESEVAEKQVNGKTNGESEVNQNGDVSKDEELSARLSVENGENAKEVNGSNGNGDSVEVEKGQGDNKVETEIPEIKVKTVAVEEPRTDPIEQPVEA